VQRIRKATRQIGKEALADIIYRYGRLGLKTSEKEVVRIAVNWMLGDQGALGDRDHTLPSGSRDVLCE